MQIKAKELINKVYPLLLSGLSGKIEVVPGVVLELFGKFNFEVTKEGDNVSIIFSGIKPRLTVNKSFLVFSADFQGRLAKITFNKSVGTLHLDGLPDQLFTFI